MGKPTYYLWKKDTDEEEFEVNKKHLTELGFHVVTFTNGNHNTSNYKDEVKRNLQMGLGEIIKNHRSRFL